MRNRNRILLPQKRVSEHRWVLLVVHGWNMAGRCGCVSAGQMPCPVDSTVF